MIKLQTEPHTKTIQEANAVSQSQSFSSHQMWEKKTPAIIPTTTL